MWEKMYTLGLKFLLMETNAGPIYSIRRNYSSEDMSDEVASLIVEINNDIVHIADLHIYKSSPLYKGYEGSHMGTNMLSGALTDIWFRKDVKYKAVTGDLSCTDARNGNWMDSISFYRNFPRYLNPNLPFDLEFTLFEKRDDRKDLIIPDDLSPENIISIFGNKELKFRYDLIPK